MRLALLVTKIAVLVPVCATVAFLHHGHIAMFVQDVRAELARAKPAALRKRHHVRVASSMLQVWFDDPATHYEVAVHRKNRTLEVGLHFEGDAAENRRMLEALAARADDIHARLGAHVEFEQWTRAWTRVHHSTPLAGEDWSPKRDLTPSLVRDSARLLGRFVRVLQPIVERSRDA
jgi:hypothetical protein